MDRLHQVMNEMNKSITKMPVMGYRELDLYTFYNEVQENGGYSQVTEKVGTWSKIWKRLGNYDTSITDASYRLKKNYEKYLLELEYRQFPDRRREDAKPKVKRNRKKSPPPHIANLRTQSAEVVNPQKRRRVKTEESIEQPFFEPNYARRISSVDSIFTRYPVSNDTPRQSPLSFSFSEHECTSSSSTPELINDFDAQLFDPRPVGAASAVTSLKQLGGASSYNLFSDENDLLRSEDPVEDFMFSDDLCAAFFDQRPLGSDDDYRQ